jgi:hypothetical protein
VRPVCWILPGGDEVTEGPDLKETLGRLLGPADPEVGCEACFDQLDRYVELELAGADVDAALPGLRAHLQGCPACREEHESLRALVSGEPS